ncbi:MAG: isoprenylcysteine carboxylmethyltransferase family protein [Chloroflexi bacterium]|nr:isoprenylcysteine carboxylmethyltransferase family protein [Chloroflexota bacterium]
MSPILKRIFQLLALVILQAAILFISAGSLRWAAGWWYIGLYLVMLLFASVVMLPNRAEVVAERSKGIKGGKSWDLKITRLLALPSLGLLILAGLDQRWSLTPPLSVWVMLLGALTFGIGYAIVVWAMLNNPFFSQVVRIQSERGHIAITSGPYRFIRHPGYFGMTVSMLGAVFLLDSLWGLICFVFYLILILIRTRLEDSTLQDELPGYAEYTSRTKYRLIPGIW